MGAGRDLFARRKDGSEYVEFATIAPIHQPGGRVTHYLAIKEDITEKKLLESELQRLGRDGEHGTLYKRLLTIPGVGPAVAAHLIYYMTRWPLACGCTIETAACTVSFSPTAVKSRSISPASIFDGRTQTQSQAIIDFRNQLEEGSSRQAKK